MRSFLRVEGWLVLTILLGIVFISARNQQIIASATPASSLADSWRLLVSISEHTLESVQAEIQVLSADVEKGLASAQRIERAVVSKLPKKRLLTIDFPGQGASAAVAQPVNKEQSVSEPRAKELPRKKPVSAPARTLRLSEASRLKQQTPPQTVRPSALPGSQQVLKIPAVEQVQRLKIPSLRVNVQVVEIPFDQFTWNVESIQQEVAKLSSLTGDQSTRNLVLAGHVTVRNGSHGPFRYLHWLKPGDFLIAETDRTIHTYQVREQIVVRPEDVSVTENTAERRLTLITCTDWSEDLKIFQRRRVVLADLVSIEPKQENRQ